MKILIFYQYYLPRNLGGVNRFNQLVSKWIEAGVDCTVICSKKSQFGVKIARGSEEEAPRGEGFGKLKIKRVGPSFGKKGNFISRIFSYMAFSVFSFFAGLFERDVDVILASSPPLTTAITGLWLRFFKRKPLVFDVRDLWPKCAVDLGFLKNPLAIKYSYHLEKKAYRKSSLISVVTPAFVDYMNENGVGDKVVYVPNFSSDIDNPDANDGEIYKDRMGLSDKFVVGYFGNHGNAANLQRIIDVAEVFMKSGTDVHFILGGAGYRRNEIIQNANDRKLNNITFIPNVPRTDVVKYVSACDVCLTPLLGNESMKTVYPSKIFTYMACSKPIVHTADGVCRELLDAAGCGLYCAPDSSLDMYDAILYMMTDEKRRIEMGASGYKYLVENFHPDDISNRYLDGIKKFIKKEK